MNLLKNTTGSLTKLSRCFSKYSTLTTPSMSHREKRSNHINNLVQTKIRNSLEQTDNDDYENEIVNSFKLSSTSKTNNSIGSENTLHQQKFLEYHQLVSSIKNLTLVESRTNFSKSLKVVDIQCCKLLGTLPASKILHLLHLFANTARTVTHLKMYKGSLLALRKHLEKDKLFDGQKLQLLFFQGLGKKSARKDVIYLLKLLPPLRYLTLMEKAVVAHTTYKCNVALDHEDARSLEEELEKNATRLVEDPLILCTICKAINMAGPSDHLSLENLSREIIAGRRIWPMPVVAHILCMYARADEKNLTVIDELFRCSMTHISSGKETLTSHLVRIKDVDKILWALSNFDYALCDSDKRALSSFFVRRYKEFQEKPFLLINSLLALWILRCKLHNVINDSLANGVFERVNEQNERWKPTARLHLLLNCIKIESPETQLPDELLRTEPKIKMQIRKSVKRLYGITDELKKKFDARDAKIDCPINGIYIAGVSLRSENTLIHLDCLDETTCLRRTIVPKGLTNLKIRLLKEIGIRSVLIPEDRSSDVEFVASTIIKSMKDTS